LTPTPASCSGPAQPTHPRASATAARRAPRGPATQARTEPVTSQRRVSATGTICVCRQTVALGRTHARRTVSIHVCEHSLSIELDDETRTIRRTTTYPVVVT
jgi:hypothetical protein